jgi:hypothetical protein
VQLTTIKTFEAIRFLGHPIFYNFHISNRKATEKPVPGRQQQGIRTKEQPAGKTYPAVSSS